MIMTSDTEPEPLTEAEMRKIARLIGAAVEHGPFMWGAVGAALALRGQFTLDDLEQAVAHMDRMNDPAANDDAS